MDIEGMFDRRRTSFQKLREVTRDYGVTDTIIKSIYTSRTQRLTGAEKLTTEVVKS